MGEAAVSRRRVVTVRKSRAIDSPIRWKERCRVGRSPIAMLEQVDRAWDPIFDGTSDLALFPVLVCGGAESGACVCRN